jgi:flagellar hook-associated protein 1 FlgK
MNSSLGINGSLFLASNALSAQRAAIEVTSHNIANANTPGYARQRANLHTATPFQTPVGQQGVGVFVNSIQQIRSTILDAQMPSNISSLSYLEEKVNLLKQVQSNLGQQLDALNSLAGTSPTSVGDGLSEAMDSFFNAFQSLSVQPTSTVLRQQVIQTAQLVASKLNTIDDNLVNLQTQIVTQIPLDLNEVNTTLATIASLNAEVQSAELAGVGQANDLRDARQKAIEDLSKKLDVYTQEESDGTLTVRLGSRTGALLVSGNFSGNTASATTVKLTLNGTAPNLTIRSWTGGEAEVPLNMDVVTPQPTGGTLAALIEAANVTIGDTTVGLIRDFDRIAAAIANLVNTQHAAGFTLEGTPAYATAGNPTFFDNNNINGDALGVVTARNIQLNVFVAGDVSRIAASSAAGQPNNGGNADSIANIRTNTTGPGLGGATLSSYFLNTLTTVGSSIQSSNSRLTTQQLVNQKLLEQRDSVMGVSLDEETVDLLRFQQAFEASARVITSLDEMMQTVLSLKR